MIVEIKEKIVKVPTPFKSNSSTCLFCKNSSKDQQDNINHMKIEHSFLIPQDNFCTNIKGLLEYLQ